MPEDSHSMDSTEYEKLPHDLVQRISDLSPLATARLEHNVVLPGRASPRQIDVLWSSRRRRGRPSGSSSSATTEKDSLEQTDMLAVDEVAYNSIPTTGVMAHLTGSLARCGPSQPRC
jgi:hypothetical protein